VSGVHPCRPKGAELVGSSTEVWNCIEKCWHQKPSERITISEVLALLSSMWVLPLSFSWGIDGAHGLEPFRTRAESNTLHASKSLIGGATTRNSTSTRRRPSGSDAHTQQRSGSQVPSRPEIPGHHQHHQLNGPPDPMGEVGVRNEGSSSSNERVTPASHLNTGPAREEHKNSGRWKRFLKRCKTIFLKGVRPTLRLSCKAANGGMSM
jgi:hypothetical protein